MEKFVENFAALFEDTEPGTIGPETRFHELDEWSSLMALSVIAMADEEYGVNLKGDDIRSSQTVGDLYDRVKALS